MATADGRVLSVIANVSRVSHGNRITKLDTFVTGKTGGREGGRRRRGEEEDGAGREGGRA